MAAQDIELTVDVNPNDLRNNIIIEFAGFLVYALNKAKPEIRKRLEEMIGISIRNSPEYLAMLPGGDLYGQIGVPNIIDVVESIIDKIKEEMEITILPPQISLSSVTIVMEIGILESSFQGLLQLPGAKFDSENGFEVEWLRWLLLEGQRRVVLGNTYLAKQGIPQSRTGFGIMVFSRQGWGFPGQYSGTVNDNWLTRAFKGQQIGKQIEQIVEDEVNKI